MSTAICRHGFSVSRCPYVLVYFYKFMGGSFALGNKILVCASWLVVDRGLCLYA